MKEDDKTKDTKVLGEPVKKDEKKLSSAVSNKKIRNLADEYMKRVSGKSLLHPKLTFEVSPERGAKAVEAYEPMKQESSEPKARRAYDALLNETIDQWNQIKKAGLKMNAPTPDMEPPSSSGLKDVFKDTAEAVPFNSPETSEFGVREKYPLMPRQQIAATEPKKADDLPSWLLDEEPTIKREKMARGGRVLMQEGGDPSFAPMDPVDTMVDRAPASEQPAIEQPTIPVPEQPATAQPEMSEYERQVREGLGATGAGGEPTPERAPITKKAQVWNVSGPTPTVIEVPHEEVQQGVLSGALSFDKTARVPVFNKEGKFGTVSGEEAEEALKSGDYRYALPREIQQYRYGSGEQSFKAGLEAAGRGIFSAPAFTGVEKLLGVAEEDILGREKANEALTGAIEMGTALAPMVLTGGEWALARMGMARAAGALGKAAEVVTKLPYPAALQKIGETIPVAGGFFATSLGLAARGALENTLYEAGEQIGHAMLHDPDFGFGNAITSLGMSALLGGGVGFALGALGKGAQKLGILGEEPRIGPLEGEPPGAGRGPPPPPTGGRPPAGSYIVDPVTGIPIKVSETAPYRQALEEAGVPLARPISEPEVPISATEAPEGVFYRRVEPSEGPEVPPTPKSQEQELFEEITGATEPKKPVLDAEGRPAKGLYLEDKDIWVSPEDAPKYSAGDPITLAKYHPELGDILHKLGNKDTIAQAFSRGAIMAKEDAREIENSIIQLGKLVGVEVHPDDIPLPFLTGNPQVHAFYEVFLNFPGVQFTPVAKQFNKIDQIYSAAFGKLLGSYHGKTSAELGEIYKKQILNRFAKNYSTFKKPYEDIENIFSKLTLSKDKLEGLLSSLKKKINNPKEAIQFEQAEAMKTAMQYIERLLEYEDLPTLYNFRKELQNVAATAFPKKFPNTLADQSKMYGYQSVWGAMKDFERNVMEGVSLEDAKALFPEYARTLQEKWLAKIDADKKYKKFSEDLYTIADIAGASQSQLSSNRSILEYIRTLSPDDLFKQMNIKSVKMNYNKLQSLQKDFPEILSAMRYVEKQKILKRAQNAQSLQEKNSLLKELKDMKVKEKSDYIFDTEKERDMFEMLMHMAKNSDWIRNFSNTAITQQVANYFMNYQAMIPSTYAMVSAPIALASYRRMLKSGRGYGAKPPKISKTREPKKYAEGGMVTALPEPSYSPQQFVDAVNRPQQMREAERLAHAMLKGEKIITNSVKSIFDPKSTYKIAQANPKNVEKLKTYVDRISKNPEVLLDSGSEIVPEMNAAFTSTMSQAVNYIKSLEPKQLQSLPFDSGIKAPPSAHQDVYHHVLKVAEQPMSLLSKVKNGTVIPEEVGALKTIYPSLYERLQNQITDHLIEAGSTGATIPYRTKLGLSAFLGSPIDTTMTPEAIQSAQIGGQKQQPGGAQMPPPQSSSKSLNKSITMAQTPMQARAFERSQGK